MKDSAKQQSLGELVLMKRRSFGWTQAQLAYEMGVSRNEIVLIEGEHSYGIKAVTLYKLTDPLRVSMSEVVDAWLETQWRRVS